MPMNSRLLRPTASGFNPRQISGLALWLDASDGSTLFQNSDGTTPATATNDPVGYWGDKSGNNRHATQATGANRPTLGASSAAGRLAVRNNGTNTVALNVAAWPYTAGNTQFAVFNVSATNQGIYQRGSLNDEPRMAIQLGANGVAALRATRGGSSLAQTHSEAGYALSQWAIGATLFNTSLGRAYRDGVYGADTTDSQTFSGDQDLRILSLPTNIYGINGGIAEFLYYDRQLTADEVDRVARYLSRRWNIALAPQVSNADAQDWVNRVYANGGTVSASTAAAVNSFCDAIDAAAIRSKFRRLNLFCGNSDASLVAVRVPLYRGESRTGTQYGNTLDTNVNFVQGDYAEATGLTGNGTSKYLNTGFNVSDLPGAANCHIASYIRGTQDIASARTLLGVLFNGVTDRYRLFLQLAGSSAPNYGIQTELGKASSASVSNRTNTNGGLLIASRTSTTSLTLYDDAVSIGTTAVSTAETTGAAPFFVFARNGPTEYYNGIMAGYSIGAGLSGAEVTSYYNALNTFQTALGRAQA